MSVASSEHNYKSAKSLYQDISDDFYEIEKNSDNDDDYLIDQTLEDIKRLNRHINRIHIEELEEEYDDNVIQTLENNIDTFKEASYFIERALMSMKLFDKIHPVLDQYLKNVEWKLISDTLDGAVKKFGRFLTSEDNYQDYKTIVGNIVKGTMSKKAFQNLFNTISSRIGKPKSKEKKDQKYPQPPEMWSKKKREEWEKMKKERREEAKKLPGWEEDKPRFDKLGESFIPFKKYLKIK